ncbi:MAG: ABC transporter ATP-binding protein [Hyphomicrobiales bacterium]|nr:ABC transporter ATP-binding protein [Hyphomicrobiales bacterium]
MASVELSGISKRWDPVVAVDDVSLTVPDGAFWVFLGPSGCGKTTLMRMVAGLEVPSAGMVRISDTDVTGLEPQERDVAMVFQSYSLYPQMSVFENIRFPLRARRVPRGEHDKRVRKAAELVELGGLLDRKPGELSGGQRQRVALARAIVRSPKVFLMDEPLSNLDARLRVSMRAQLKHLHETLGTTVIYVTHDQVEAMTLADRVVVMNAGRIEQIGSPREIYDDPRTTFVARFVGSPSMNLISGRIDEAQFRLGDIAVAVPGTADAGEATLGIRCEDLRLCDPSDAGIVGTVYASELIGDATLVTVVAEDHQVIAKVGKDTHVKSGERVGLETIGPRFLFDAATGGRVDSA